MGASASAVSELSPLEDEQPEMQHFIPETERTEGDHTLYLCGGLHGESGTAGFCCCFGYLTG